MSVPKIQASAAAAVFEEPHSASEEQLWIQPYNMCGRYAPPPNVVRITDSFTEIIGPRITQALEGTGANVREVDVRMLEYLPGFYENSERKIKKEVRKAIKKYCSVGDRTQSIGQTILQNAAPGSVIQKIQEAIVEQLKGAEGIALSGGDDIEPEFYIPGIPFPKGSDYFRAIAEFAAIQYAEDNEVPIIGTCRGIQILNVFYGGTLRNVDGQEAVWQQLAFTDAPQSAKIQTLFSTTAALSLHRQACDEIAPRFIKVLEHDGVTKCIMSNEGRIIAVQFHPELDKGHLENKPSGMYSNAIKIYELFYQKIEEQREKLQAQDVEVYV